MAMAGRTTSHAAHQVRRREQRQVMLLCSACTRSMTWRHRANGAVLDSGALGAEPRHARGTAKAEDGRQRTQAHL
jgi:hypothetical protein